MPKQPLGRRMRWAPVLVVAVLLAACGQQGTGQPAGSTPTTTRGTTGPAAPTGGGTPTRAGGTELEVRETEFAIALPRTSLAPGSYTFKVKNEGGAPHDLVIKGPGVESARTPVLNGGEEATLDVALQPGSYEVWCSVGNHRQQGMDITIAVG